MLYNILVPLSNEWTVLNVFRYITFRSAWAMITALIISIAVGPIFIEWLRKLKFGQYIHEDVTTHSAKAGTPTMGGLLIMFSLIVSVLLWGDLSNIYLWLTIYVFAGFGILGFIDDMVKIRGKKNQGISVKVKFIGQIIVAGSAMLVLVEQPGFNTTLSIPIFKDVAPDLGWFYIPFAIVVMVGASNAVNLTDGLDGLAIGPTVVVGIVLSVFIYVTGHVQFSQYLIVPYIAGVGEVTVFCAALVGAGLGFLWYNAYPAQVFMGDVGSLSLGGVLGFLAVLCKQELILVVVGGLFVAETLSVILQVGYFKWTGGKRMFRMAPLHHHFELKGVPESKIIIRFWITSILLGLLALSMLKLR